MNTRRWLAVFAACTVASVIAVHSVISIRQLAAAVQNRESRSAQASTSVPDHIVYGFLFRNVTRNIERNLELQAKGLAPKKYFPFKRELGFTAEQSRFVSQIATECDLQVKQQDKNAQLIIAQFRSKLPKTKDAPAPPTELSTMWEERNAMILTARDRLRDALGSETFERLDNFAKYRYGTNKAPVSLRPIDRQGNQE